MATIRAYSTIEQSRKLAVSLPIESADCFWDYDEMQKFHRINWFEDGYDKDSQLRLSKNNICAWSLAALLGMLPKRIEIVDNVYELSVYLYGLYYWNINNGNLCFESKDKDNLVDACYEMIIMLSKNGLI